MSKKTIINLYIDKLSIIINLNTLTIFNTLNIINRTLLLNNIYIIIYKGFLYLESLPNSINNTNPLIGTYHSIIVNMIKGCQSLYSSKLLILGTGYNVSLNNTKLIFNLGYSYPVIILIPNLITVTISPSGKELTLISIDNILLGNYISIILRLRKFNSYKNKGIIMIEPYKTIITLKKINKR